MPHFHFPSSPDLKIHTPEVFRLPPAANIRKPSHEKVFEFRDLGKGNLMKHGKAVGVAGAAAQK